MSKLLSKGISASVIATIETYAANIKATNIRDLAQISRAISHSNDIVSHLSNCINGRDAINKVCEEALGLSYIRCDHSGNWLPKQLIVTLPGGKRASAHLLLNGAFAWEYSGDHIVRASRLYGDRDVLGYNEDPMKHLKFKCMPNEKLVYDNNEDIGINDEYSGVAPILMGIELEVERKSNCPPKLEHLVINDLGMDYAILKNDGSLQNGFEIVTAPSTLAYHLQAWDKFFDTKTGSSRYVTSWASGRCGMHIHISRKTFTPLHLGKFITFINNHENRDFITTIAGRNSTYAAFNEERPFSVKSKMVSTYHSLKEALNKETSESKKEDILKQMADISKAMKATKADCTNLINTTVGGGGRGAVNCTKHDGKTVEVRIFKGNVSRIGMLKNIEFTAAAVKFTREATFRTHELTKEEVIERKRKNKENTDYTLHFTYFLDWLSKDTTGDYNNLKLWLAEHKISDKYRKRKQTNKTPVDKRIVDADVRAVA